MIVHRRDRSAIPAAIAAMGQQILAPTDRSRVIGDHLADRLDAAQGAARYEPTRRAAISPSRLALVTLFQFMEDRPDRAQLAAAALLPAEHAASLPGGGQAALRVSAQGGGLQPQATGAGAAGRRFVRMWHTDGNRRRRGAEPCHAASQGECAHD